MRRVFTSNPGQLYLIYIYIYICIYFAADDVCSIADPPKHALWQRLDDILLLLNVCKDSIKDLDIAADTFFRKGGPRARRLKKIGSTAAAIMRIAAELEVESSHTSTDALMMLCLES